MDETLVFDIETDGLDPTLVHCIVIVGEDGVATRYRHPEALDRFYASGASLERVAIADALPLDEGLYRLQEADTLVGHNILGYDIPVLKRLYGCQFRGNYFDTMIAAATTWVDTKGQDYNNPRMSKQLVGRHSLRAWGMRLGVLKDTFTEDGGSWDRWTPGMEDYCEQDVAVTRALYHHLKRNSKLPEQALELEQAFYSLMVEQQRHGFLFDRATAEKLYVGISARLEGLTVELQDAFEPRLIPYKRVYRGKTHKSIPFNPGSRKQIGERLAELGWKPTEFTETGQAKIDEETLAGLAELHPGVALLAEYLLLQKRAGQLADGRGGWLKLVGDDYRIHGRVVSAGGTVSHRCAHKKPNIAQTPRVGNPWGKEFRSLFCVPEGKVLVGCDVSGLELRVLGHYLAKWDNGAYVHEILEGDIHTKNQQMAGLDTRDQAKTFIYALIYGAGNGKLGSIIGGSEKEGAALRRRFMTANPAFKMLVEQVKQTVKKKRVLRCLDGRLLYPRSQHSALNLLIQAAGAILVKMATVMFVSRLQENGLTWGEDYALVAHVHDEWQTETWPEHSSLIQESALAAIIDAGAFYGLRCPLAGEAKEGLTWADTH